MVFFNKSNKDLFSKLIPINCMVLEFCGSKYYTIPCTISLSIWVWADLLQVPYILQFSVDSFMKYGAVFFGASGIILMTTSMLFNFKKWERSRKGLTQDGSWSLERVGPAEIKKIKQTCRLADILLMFDAILIIISGFFKQLEMEDNGFRCLVIAELIDKHYPPLKIIFLLLERITFLLFASAFVISPYHIIFFCTPMKIWLAILNNDVVMFSEKLRKMKGQNCDQYVTQSLKCIIRRYNFLVRKHREILQQYIVSFLIYTFSILLFILYQVMAYFEHDTEMSSLASGTVVFIIRVFYFSHQAQLLEDEQDEFRRLICTLDWYDWSVPNQKLFHIFLIHASVDLSANITPLVKFNHLYFKEFVKNLFTVASLGRTIVNR